jgi:hypothetical protein
VNKNVVGVPVLVAASACAADEESEIDGFAGDATRAVYRRPAIASSSGAWDPAILVEEATDGS